MKGGECAKYLTCINSVNCSDSQSDPTLAAGAFVCSCNRGWEGRRCNEDVDECSSAPCEHGGVFLGTTRIIGFYVDKGFILTETPDRYWDCQGFGFRASGNIVLQRSSCIRSS